VNLPSASVTVPEEAPFSVTLAPATGAPFSADTTVPDTFRVWDCDGKANAQQAANNSNTLFIWKLFR
jgi:hypothetical protein